MYKILDGRIVSDHIKNKILQCRENLKKNYVVPGLAVIMVGNDAASEIYVSNKIKFCNSLGFCSKLYNLNKNATESELLDLINKLNYSSDTHGILVQLPIPININKAIVQDSILPEKDVDVFNSVNIAKLLRNNATLLPCTPAGIIELLKFYNISLSGKHCVILGRSDIVGKPLAILMLQADATVTICHSKSENLTDICKTADILISAVGSPSMISANMVKSGAVVIDVGITRSESGKLFGDVDFENVAPKCSFITPVPGGVGPMTVTMLMKNTLLAANESIRKDFL